MPERDAFIAAVAAAPSDDLPRLVFADWLDENGEPERAEFIRTQIRWHHADATEKQHLNTRAAYLFRDHWRRWLRPFLLALEPGRDPADWREINPAIAGFAAILRPQWSEPAVNVFSLSRGFVANMSVRVDLWDGPGDLGTAFAHEPVVSLNLANPLHSPHWGRFTHPALRRVVQVLVAQQWEWGVSAPESTAFLEDPHLAGVRVFGISPVGLGPATPPLPAAWLERFVRSALAYRLNWLILSNLTDAGVGAVCRRADRLHLEQLDLSGALSAAVVRPMAQSGLAGTVRGLRLVSAELGNTGAAALAREGWPRLTELGLRSCRLTSAVLPALAAAEFTPRLKVLDLSDNPLFADPTATLAGLQTLGETLDPGSLERLDLSATGLTAVPDFLAERFGDRVTIG